MRSINQFCYNFDSPYQFSILLLLNVGKYFHCCVLLLYQAIAPSQAIFFIEFLYLKLTSSIAISFLYPTLSAFSISLSMQKSYFASFWKGFMYIKYPQSQLERFHKEILFNIKLYQSSIKASLSLTLHTAPHFSLQFAYLTLKELYGKSKQRFQSKAKISSTFCWKFYSISNPWESLLEHFCSIRKRRTLV